MFFFFGYVFSYVLKISCGISQENPFAGNIFLCHQSFSLVLSLARRLSSALNVTLLVCSFFVFCLSHQMPLRGKSCRGSRWLGFSPPLRPCPHHVLPPSVPSPTPALSPGFTPFLAAAHMTRTGSVGMCAEARYRIHHRTWHSRSRDVSRTVMSVWDDQNLLRYSPSAGGRPSNIKHMLYLQFLLSETP